MSTFDGHVSEFPDILIDRFNGDRRPLACFLSHVHSDHLMGLEQLRSPFVYCSAATRELLLRLERFSHRINFARGTLESRVRTYKHLRKIVKALPLDTPVVIELSPSKSIEVTLFNANHCLGAVMFLIKGDGRSILYTGDVRAEQWWIDALVRTPVMVPYTTFERLDRVYLDTTFADSSDPCQHFPSKLDGVGELLRKLQTYPPSTRYYFNAWTFGYEDVWQTLSQALGTKIHLDDYRYGIYTSIAKSSERFSPSEIAVLCGCTFGNRQQAGILTIDDSVRLHSCERAAGCSILKDPNTVFITPIIARHGDVDVVELGAGGGGGDLDTVHELELPNADDLGVLSKLAQLGVKSDMIDAIKATLTEQAHTTMRIASTHLNRLHDDDEDLKLPQILPSLSSPGCPRHVTQAKRHITFPYSRHSSNSELRAFITALQPLDIYPCTSPPPSQWTEAHSMRAVFGDIIDLSGTKCAYDTHMRQLTSNLTRQTVVVSPGQNLSQASVSSLKPLHQAAKSVRSSQAETVSDYDSFHDTSAVSEYAYASQNITEPLLDSIENETSQSPAVDQEHDKRRLNSMYPECLFDGDSQTDSLESSRKRRRTDAFDAAAEGRWMGVELECLTRQSPEL